MWWLIVSAGLALLLVFAYFAATLLGERVWTRATRELEARLSAQRVQHTATRYQESELQGLPAPVQRCFRAVLKDGQPVVNAVRLSHQGTFNLSADADNWKHFESQQQVVARPPGFVWDARISLLPGVAVRVHDAYIAGEGILHPAFMGLVPLGRQHDRGQLAQGELMRFLAEAAWYPTVLLPGQGVRWTPVDDRSARAVLSDGDLEVALTFFFGADNLIARVYTEARTRRLGKHVENLAWGGRFWNYVERGGLRIPLEGEVAWIGRGGEAPYWRGTLTSIAFDFAGEGAPSGPSAPQASIN
jgi:hypothetical protein